jgi:uncharacterized protein YceK
MKKIVIVALMFMAVTGLSGCGITVPKQATTEQKLQDNVVTKTGTIMTKTETDYLLSTTDGMTNITSTKVNLDNYMKKKVTVTGMFSGTTLYVDKIELAN